MQPAISPLKSTLNNNLPAYAWGLAAGAIAVSVLIWGQSLRWQFDFVSIYTFFPLLGLIAFGTMWSQYVAGSLRRIAGVDPTVLRPFSETTSHVVITAILLHPGLLVWQLWRDGYGLPPGSYYTYVGPALAWAATLGAVSLLAFLAFELRHRYSGRSWWKYVDYANDAAILAIYIHAWNLGGHTHLSWFYPVWIFFGVTLAASLGHKYASLSAAKAANTKSPE